MYMPIINPIYLYLIEVLHNLDVINNLVFIALAFVVSLLIIILVPTKDAMYKMLIASYVTTDNIQIVNEAIKTNIQDYLNMLGETVKNMR